MTEHFIDEEKGTAVCSPAIHPFGGEPTTPNRFMDQRFGGRLCSSWVKIHSYIGRTRVVATQSVSTVDAIQYVLSYIVTTTHRSKVQCIGFGQAPWPPTPFGSTKPRTFGKIRSLCVAQGFGFGYAADVDTLLNRLSTAPRVFHARRRAHPFPAVQEHGTDRDTLSIRRHRKTVRCFFLGAVRVRGDEY